MMVVAILKKSSSANAILNVHLDLKLKGNTATKSAQNMVDGPRIKKEHVKSQIL